MVMLDAENGKEQWNKKFGNPVFSTVYSGTITEPTENTVYLAVFEGQSEKLKAKRLSRLLLPYGVKRRYRNELWRYQEEDFIFQDPNLFDNGMIVVTQNGIKAYQAGKNTQVAVQKVSDATDNQPSSNSNTELVDLETFEGRWSTPGSDELAINISITDDKNGSSHISLKGRRIQSLSNTFNQAIVS
ncbi:hypothetical protein [Paenibacillus sp. DMB20]|uniref:hypothetical protein n=1 Tax=Paenibacillus sp. DMB20 TaxID=1642570 RepID=UPI000627ACB9|nr:hypothetical protein [Paenibacillus sp. DMB20]KKO53977.1 hypothetical protein XI25_07470 [Paenibacillus sp. DMB20]